MHERFREVITTIRYGPPQGRMTLPQVIERWAHLGIDVRMDHRYRQLVESKFFITMAARYNTNLVERRRAALAEHHRHAVQVVREDRARGRAGRVQPRRLQMRDYAPGRW